ncbi:MULTISPECIES: hypothetical protein [unclassified Moorena]|nr:MULTISPECIES: hypothetical protein [unclassified Moorena]NEO16629.1 hypothetical protein [Moorena sp. SIO3E8]NEP98630.1 hypothetical protein [Moorena sp. SIO3F7]
MLNITKKIVRSRSGSLLAVPDAARTEHRHLVWYFINQPKQLLLPSPWAC